MPELATEKVFPNQKIGEITYTVVINPLGFEMHSMLWDLMSNYNVDRAGRQGADVQIGRAKDTVFLNAIKKLTVEGKDVALRADFALANLPKYTDAEYRGGFPDRLLRHILEVNPFIGLAENAPFTMIFRPYLPEELRNRQDPTQSEEPIQTDSQDTAPSDEQQTGADTSTSEPTSTSPPTRRLQTAQQSGESSKKNENEAAES